MKKSDLRRIIREEIEKVLSEAPQPQIAEPETDVETKPTTPEDDEFSTKPNKPKPEKTKAETSQAKKLAKDIAEKYAVLKKSKK
jgi:hypothetical protein